MNQELKQVIKEIPLKDRVKIVALNHYQQLLTKTSIEVQKKIRNLEFNHLKSMMPLQKKFNEIISGERVPTKEEIAELQDVELKDIKLEPIKDFWLKVIANSEVLSQYINKDDCPILSNLNKIDAKISEDNKNFTIQFNFQPNEFFENTVLEKQFIYEEDAEDELPSKTKSSEIKWKNGKNVTKKIIKKKQRNKKTGQQRVIEKEVPVESFFSFFTDVDRKQVNLDEETEDGNIITPEVKFEMDVEIGQHFLESIIPEAFKHYMNLKGDDQIFDDVLDEDEQDEISDNDEE